MKQLGNNSDQTKNSITLVEDYPPNQVPSGYDNALLYRSWNILIYAILGPSMQLPNHAVII